MKWFINLFLVFSLLTFSGFASEVSEGSRQSTQTELRVTHKVSVKRTAYYKKPAVFFYLPDWKNKSVAQLQYQKIIDIKFRRARSEHIAFNNPKKDFRVIPSPDKTFEFNTNQA